MSRAVLFALVAAIAGCRSGDQRLTREAGPARTASLGGWQARTVGGEPAPSAAARLAALVCRGCAGMGIEVRGEGDQRSAMLTIKSLAGGPADGAGSAVPLTADGYFLTAAHCVSSGPVMVGLFTPRGGSVILDSAPARVVWRDDAGTDLALVHAPLAPSRRAEWAGRELATGGAEVIAAGLGASSTRCAAGRITAGPTGQEEAAPGQALEFLIDAPLMPGDSGGPALLFVPGPLGEGELRLLGIGIEATVPDGTGRFRSIIARPNPAFIAELIEADRAGRGAGPGTALGQLSPICPIRACGVFRLR